jgi:hypothetical protein
LLRLGADFAGFKHEGPRELVSNANRVRRDECILISIRPKKGLELGERDIPKAIRLANSK